MIRTRATSPARRNRSPRALRPAIEVFEARLLMSGDVLTYHNDNARTGQYLTETTLTPADVNTSSFGKQFALAVDGQVWAEPLYVSGVDVPGVGVRNVVYVATMHDSVYAFDADAPGLPLWHVDQNGTRADGTVVTSVPMPDIGGNDIKVEVGILGTPVIDRASGTIYFVARTKETLGGVSSYVQTLHALDIATGAERPSGPTVIAATVAGAGTGGDASGNIAFDGLIENQRPGLLLSGGVVYIAWASHSDGGPYHGWLLGYDAATLKQVAVWNTTPDGQEGGIWASGAAPSADEQGNILLTSGNGTFDANLPGGRDYGDSVVELAPGGAAGLTVRDFFTPYNQQWLQDHDIDLGSSGVLLLPPLVKDGVTHMYALVGGKQGYYYMLDRDPTHLTAAPYSGLGGFDGSANAYDHIVQTGGLAGAAFTAPAYFNGRVYLAGTYSPLHAYAVDGAGWTLAGTSTTPETYKFPCATPVISANGAADGIVWAIQADAFGAGGPAVLRAYDPANLAHEYYASDQAPGGRDQAGPAVKFTVPTVAGGHVFVGADHSLTIYGLIQRPGGLAAPAATTGLAVASASATEVDLTWAAGSADQQGFVVERSTDGGASYAIALRLGPDARSAAITGLQGRTAYSFRVRAYNAQGESAPGSALAVTTPAPAGGIDFSAGFAAARGSIALNGTAKLLGSAIQLTEAIAYQAGSAFDVSPVDVTRFHTRFRYLPIGNGEGFTFTLQNDSLKAVGDIGGALGYGSYYTPVAMPHSFALDLVIPNSQTGVSTGGSPTGGPRYSIGNGVDLTLGHPIDVDLSYDGATLTESLVDAADGATAVRTYAVDIPGAIGSRFAYAGFTASTGGIRAVQQVQSWTYAETRVPAAPTGLSAAATSPYAVSLAWVDNADNELGFAVEASTDGGLNFRQVATAGAGATSIALAGLSPGTAYAFRVEAFKGPLTSPPSNVASATTPPLVFPPRTPTYAFATLVTSDRIDLAWVDNADNEDGYRVLRKTGTDGAIVLVATLPANSTTYQDPGLSPATDYEYHVQAYNAGGYSDFTGVGATTLAAGVDLSSGFAGLSGWDLNGSVKVVGSALRLTDGGVFQAGSAFDATPLDASRFGVTFRVRADRAPADGLTFVVQGDGPTIAGDVGGALGFGTYYGPIRLPHGLAVKFGLDGTTGLFLGGALPAGGTWPGPSLGNLNVLAVSIAYDGATLSVTEVDETTGARATQAYPVDIAAVVGPGPAWMGFTAGSGTNSAELDVLGFTYAPARPPTPPTALTAAVASPSEVDLRWLDHSEDELGFAVEASTDGGATYTRLATAPAGATSAALAGLAPSTTYRFRVRAFNAYGASDPAAADPATTPASALAVDQGKGFAGLTGWALNGTTRVVGTALRLTDGGAFQAGSAFASTRVDTSRFQANFRMRSTLSQRNGLTFTLQAVGGGALGDIGGAMGYGTYYGPTRLLNSVAVKIGLDGTTGLYLNGALPSGGQPMGPGVDPSHDILDVSLAYDGSRLAVTEFDETTGATATQLYTVDIPGAIGSTYAWAGFTGSTGTTLAVMDILAFTYAPTRPPAAPTGLTAAATAGKITLGWTDHADNESGFDVERSADGGATFVLLASTGANASAYVDAAVTPGQTYVYRVRARNGAGLSAYSNLATATAV